MSNKQILISKNDLRSLAAEFADAVLEQAAELNYVGIEDFVDEFIRNVEDVASHE